MPSASVIFDGDTQRFRAEVDAAGNSVSKSADAIAAAKNRILDSFNAQVKSATETGVSAEKLASIQTKAAQSMATVTESNANKIINSLDRIAARQKAVTAELGNLKVPHVAENDITDRQRASALLRGGGVRSAENFLTQFSAFNAVAQVAFPILGAATFAGEVIRGVAALKEMYDTAQKIPSVLKEGFESFNAPLLLNVDTLRKANDELEISIAHLEHKPANTLALALDEARINADHLAESAARAATDVEKLLKENKVGFLMTGFTGQVATGAVSDEVNKRMQELRDLQRADRDALRSGHDTPQAAQGRQQQISGAEHALGQWAKDTRDTITSMAKKEGVPTSALQGNLNILSGVQDYSDNLQDERAEQARNTADQQHQKQLQDADKRAQDAKEAQRKAQEAMRKAIEAQRQLWQAQDDQLKDAGGDTAALEAYAWQARIDALKKGSAGYAEQMRYAQHELATATAEVHRQDAEAAKKAADQANKQQSEQFGLQRDNYATTGNRTPQQMADLAGIQMLEALPANVKEATDRWKEAQAAADRYAEEASKAADKAAEVAARNRAQVDLATLAIAQQTGQVSRLDAAQQTANIHAQEYATTMAALRKTLAQASAVDPNGANAINAQAAIDKADAERKVQVMQDAANTAAATWQGALRNANTATVQEFKDGAAQVVAFYRQALDGFNADIVEAMVGKNKKENWSKTFEGLGKTLAGDSLKNMESSVLGKFGVHTGKPDGSKSSPFSVSIVNGVPQMGSSLSALGAAMSGSSGNSGSGSSSSGFIGGIGKFFASIFGGARAMGGGVDFGSTYLVGEAGPELFSPKTSGTIVPNHALGSGGMNFAPTVQVMNGVTPSQMEMRLHSVMRQSMPSLMHAARASHKDAQSRRPSTHR